jgi:hypothetical protein
LAEGFVSAIHSALGQRSASTTAIHRWIARYGSLRSQGRQRG